MPISTGDGSWYPLWSFREDVYLEEGTSGLTLHSRWEDVHVPEPAPAVREALWRMTLGPISLENVIHQAADRREIGELLDGLQQCVVRSFGSDPEQAAFSVIPLSPRARLRLPENLDLPVRLSRFAVMSADGQDWRMESPLSTLRVVFHRADAVSLIGSLHRPIVPDALRPDARFLVSYLIGAGMAIEGDRSARFAEDSDPILVTWSPGDLMFHSRTTLGRHDQDFGAIYPLGADRSPEPVVKPPRGAEHVRLFKPRWEGLVETDPPVTAALEARMPYGGAGPISEEVLGELLYRTARVRSLIGSSDPESTTGTSDRPYIGSGRCYELELYVVANECDGIDRGIYHYDPLGHDLVRVRSDIGMTEAGVDELLENARVMGGLDRAPSILITFTARFRRMSWKYDGLSYALVLKNVGALAQTLSLVGKVLGLAVRVLDSDDVEASSRILGIDWRTESGVGGIAIGGGGADETQSSWCAVNDAEWPLIAARMMQNPPS